MPHTTHTAHAAFGPFNEIDLLMSTGKPEVGFADYNHNEIRAHDFHCKFAISVRFTVQVEMKRQATGKIVGLTCRKL
jgi:hypothetical protein